MNDTLKFIGGFLLGGACGVAAGLLMAPTTGKQARKKLGKKSRKLARKMAELVGQEEKFQATTPRRRNSKTPVES